MTNEASFTPTMNDIVDTIKISTCRFHTMRDKMRSIASLSTDTATVKYLREYEGELDSLEIVQYSRQQIACAPPRQI